MKKIKKRLYAHFDNPLSDAERETFSINPSQAAKHGFYPLLGFTKTQRKIDFALTPPSAVLKNRDIRYASHRDAAIYSRYAEELGARYEAFISNIGVSDFVLAYRSEIGFNITFANSLFKEIISRGDCHVICMDISGFFDNIDHKILDQRLKSVLGVARLSPDWFNVIKSVTKYAHVSKEDIEKVLKRKIQGRICYPAVFRDKIRPVIKKHADPFGIPQGTPLSGLLANIYLWQFDKVLASYADRVGGSYRRYSDDIAIVLPINVDKDAAIRAVHTSLLYHQLSAKDSKTCETTFKKFSDAIQSSGDILQYLGFVFDGKNIHIRPQSMKNFYARMKVNIRGYIKAASKSKIPKNELHRRVLVGRFTHWGDARNFVQYAYRASREMNAPEIKRQLRRHVEIFDSYWKACLDRYY